MKLWTWFKYQRAASTYSARLPRALRQRYG